MGGVVLKYGALTTVAKESTTKGTFTVSAPDVDGWRTVVLTVPAGSRLDGIKGGQNTGRTALAVRSVGKGLDWEVLSLTLGAEVAQ